MALLAPALFLNHGGGPLPILGDKENIGIANFLRDEVKAHVNLNLLTAIIVVTAHWEEDIVAVSSGKHHDLYYDYYNYPPETYKYRYNAPGEPELAKRIHTALNNSGIESKLDPIRGWDHGLFIPMMLINPAANIPIVQVSVLSNQDPDAHFRLGEALYQFRKEGVAIFGSGMSYHNMRQLQGKKHSGPVVNIGFDRYLIDACTSSNEITREKLMSWDQQPGARDVHPPKEAEHLMPLIVAAGAGGQGPGETFFHWDMSDTFRLSGFIWREE